MKYEIGLIGLAVMGQNLALNFRDNGHSISVWNRSHSKTDTFLQANSSSEDPAHGQLAGFENLDSFVDSLASPRIIFLMVKSGTAVDDTIALLLPLLDKDDIIIDGGNSDFTDTELRANKLKEQHIRYVGCGVSGGEEGARFGPSIMPGGDDSCWDIIKPLLQSISAKVENKPCCEWLGKGGAGHFVKMVHNGIEYGDMQLIAETYNLLSKVCQFNNQQLSQQFSIWNEGVLNSYLIEITADIFKFTDENNDYVIDTILDSAGQKGTGRLTAINAMEQGTPLSIISEAVLARTLSARKEERLKAASSLKIQTLCSQSVTLDDEIIADYCLIFEEALFAAKILSYTQGFMLLKDTSQAKSWDLNMSGIAAIWRGGCIIRSQFLNDITAAFEKQPELDNLLFSDYFKQAIQRCEMSLRKAVILATQWGIAIPAYSSALSFLDGIRQADSPANLTQAQRDYFGAHTYEKKHSPRGEFFHTDWSGLDGNITSGSYDA
jgi:6-phosphogluconate dehydrogenase